MARKNYRVNILSVSSIEQLKRELTEYKRQIPSKMETFVSRLADIGIKVGRTNTGVLDDLGNVSHLVRFTKEVSQNQYGAKAVMVMADEMTVTKAWLGIGGEVKTAEVSPSLMYEYGSGLEAKDKNAIKNPQGGRGTFPGQTHARNDSGWRWKDLDGTWHHSTGITPTTPMYEASMEMQKQIVAIAKEVFG